jgi:hypothetical protein
MILKFKWYSLNLRLSGFSWNNLQVQLQIFNKIMFMWKDKYEIKWSQFESLRVQLFMIFDQFIVV